MTLVNWFVHAAAATAAVAWLVASPAIAANSEVPLTNALQAQLFQVSGARASFEALAKAKLPLDVWSIRTASVTGDGVNLDVDGDEEIMLQADILTTRATIEQLVNPLTGHDIPLNLPGGLKAVIHPRKPDWKFHVSTPQDTEKRAKTDRIEVLSCLYAIKLYMFDIPQLDQYTDSAYFDCFHPHGQVFEFIDALVEANSDLIVKHQRVSITFENRSIPAYQISTTTRNNSRLGANPEKKTLYTQSLVHAREWQAGASVVFTMVSILDDLRAGDPVVTALFDEFDWVFVPIVNIDGYKYSWDHDRYWRTNRHVTDEYEGVDLNRNFESGELAGAQGNSIGTNTNPGKFALSEPETAGLHTFIKMLPNLAGIVDVHSYGGLVLRPFSDSPDEPVDPYGPAMVLLADAVRDAINGNSSSNATYESITGHELYAAYGCFTDNMFREFNSKVPSITIEVEGDDFTAPQKSIRDVGANVYRGLQQFAMETTTYRTALKTSIF